MNLPILRRSLAKRAPPRRNDPALATNCLRRGVGASTDCQGWGKTAGTRFAGRKGETQLSGFVAVAAVSDLPPGAKKLVNVGGVEVLLCNSLDRVFAVENRCSHAEERLDCGRVRSGWIACPVHGARFDLASGEPINPPATEPIQTYAVRISGDQIEVAL